MKWIIVILSLLVLSKADCDASLFGKCYTKSVIFNNFNMYSYFDTSRLENVIYFLSLNHTEGKLEYSNLRLNLTDGHFSKISNISELSTSRVVDQNTGIVYIGTGQGIYRYDPKTKETKYILRESIVTLRFNKKLYFSRNKHGICTLNENYVKNCIAPLN